MSFDYLIVYESNNEKIRVGSENDGGYVIAENIGEYDCMISCGIANDVNFEKAMLNKYQDIVCYCYDGTIDTLPENHDRLVFFKKNISYFDSDKTTNLIELIKKYDNIFLKMDIESYEFRWLQVMPIELLKKIKQIVIEFHFPLSDLVIQHFDIPLPIYQKVDVFKKLLRTHTLIHLHANNCCGVSLVDEIIVPNVFECTYVRNDYQTRDKKSHDPIPSILDRPNIKDYPEIELHGYPFVHS